MKTMFKGLLMLMLAVGLTNAVKAQCGAGFTFSVNGTTVTFYDSSYSAGGSFMHYWNFGDGTNSTAANPQHQYNAPGSYTVCLLIYDSTCSDTFCTSVTIGGGGGGGNCQANYNDSISGLHVFFVNRSTGISASTSYQWSFGDGSGSNLENPDHQFVQSGTYRVCLTIYDSANSCSNQFCSNVQVSSSSNCKASFADSIGAGNNVYFANTSNGTNVGTSYFWDFGDSTTGTGAFATHQFPGPGTYNVCLTISDSTCTDKVCRNITIAGSSSCKADFSYTTRGKTVYFNNLSSASGNISYFWSFGDGTSSSATNPSHAYQTIGTRNVCLIVSSGNCADTFCVTITVTNQYQVTGRVSLGSTGNAAYPAMAWAIQYDSTQGGWLTAVDSTYSDSNGTYYFWLNGGDYLFKAALTDSNSQQYSNYLPTYHFDKLRWDTANLVTVSSDTTGLDIHMIGGNNPGGPGFIGGSVKQGANKTGATGDPMAHIYIYLTDANNNPVAYTYSDAQGNFGFSNLAYGTYQVVSDLIGKLSGSYTVTLSAQKPSVTNVGVEVNSKSVVIQQGISAVSAASLGIKLYPNPANQYLNIERNQSGNCQYMLTDLSGRIIQSGQFTERLYTLDLEQIHPGVYIISLTNGSGELTTARIIIH